MGGRKGYYLKEIVGKISIKEPQEELIEGIQRENITKAVKASVKILSKSGKALDSLVYSYLFVDSIKEDYDKLRKEKTKERRKNLAKRWAFFRKKKGKKFDIKTNRNVVDSANRVLGGGK